MEETELLKYTDEKTKLMQQYVSNYGSIAYLENEFANKKQVMIRYAKEDRWTEKGLMLYYEGCINPSKLFKNERKDYIKVWGDESSKPLKSIKEDGRFTYVTYYKYFDSLQIKFRFTRNTLDHVQICEYDENTRLILSVTNFYFFCPHDDNDNRDVLSSLWTLNDIYGEIYSYKNDEISKDVNYMLMLYLFDEEESKFLQLKDRVMSFFVSEYTFQHSDGCAKLYNSLYNNSKRDGTKLYRKCERDFSKYHYYDKYFFGKI